MIDQKKRQGNVIHFEEEKNISINRYWYRNDKNTEMSRQGLQTVKHNSVQTCKV